MVTHSRLQTPQRRFALGLAVVLFLTLTGAASGAAFDDFAALAQRGASQAELVRFIDAQRITAEGFPLRRGLAVTFVYRGAASAVSVAGEWNGWSKSAARLTRVGQTDVWFASQTLPRADRFQYKLVVDGRWTRDPLNRKLVLGPNRNSALNLAGSGKSHLELHAAQVSFQLGNSRDVFVYLPRGALDGGQYPVTYMHDGQNLFDRETSYGGWQLDSVLDHEIDSGKVVPVIVVGLANTSERMDEYAPVEDDISGNCSGSRMGGRAQIYADWIVSDIKPLIDQTYPTLADRANTAVLGSSLGGLVSLYMGFRYPQVFKNVGGMSSTLGWGRICLQNPRVYEQAEAAGKLDLRIYLDSGGDGQKSPDRDNFGVTDELKLLFERQGYQHGVNLKHWWEPGAPHNEAAWRARVEKPFRFWFPR